MPWLAWMAVVAVVGAEAGIWYPTLIGWFKKNVPDYHVASAGDSGGLQAVKLFAASLVIAAIVVLLGFAAFLGDATNQAKLEATGVLAFLSVFTYGYTAGSLFETPLRK
jgi:hypothetical protein